jgi:hypothetical protein
MKNLNNIFVLILACSFLSCEKDDLVEPVKKIEQLNNSEILKLIEGKTPVAESEPIVFNKFDHTSLASRDGGIMLHAVGDWQSLTKKEMTEAGFGSYDLASNAFKQKYNQLNPSNQLSAWGWFKCVSSNIGMNNGFHNGAYSTPSAYQTVDPHKNRPNLFLPAKWRYSGTAMPTISLMKPYSNYKGEALQMTNYTTKKRNYGGQLWKTIAVTTESSVSIDVSGTVGTTFKAGFEFLAQAEVDVSVTAGRTGTTSTSETITTNFYLPDFDVPPGRSVAYVLMHKYEQGKISYVMPLNFTGTIGANYGAYRHSDFISVPANSFNANFNVPRTQIKAVVNEQINHFVTVQAFLVDL